ncbi:hypothetical protein [Sphingopyxis granuli]|uniref:hypothetical protein n=1 Tax=Sphingopyxis granuli TaxID=267128 RepID=UPI003B968E3F
MAFQRHAHRRVALEPLRLALQRRLILGIDIILVEAEEDAVGGDAGDEIFLRSGDDAGAGIGAGVGSGAFGRGGSSFGGFGEQAPTASMVIAAIIAVLLRIVMSSVLLLLWSVVVSRGINPCCTR